MPLTLEQERKLLHWQACVGKQSSQILVEGDTIVPDNKPDVWELLRWEGRVHIKEVRAMEERLSFSGELSVSVLYRAKKGERPLYGMEMTLPIEDLLHIDGLEPDMTVSFRAEPEHLECQVINDRKIGVKAVIRIEAQARKAEEREILCGVSEEGIACLKGSLQMERETAEIKDRFPVKEEIRISAAQPEIVDVLWQEATLTEQELRPAEGRVLVRGSVMLSMLYCDAEGQIGSFSEKIPFHGALDGVGVQPKTELQGELTIEDAKLTPTVDEDGETREVAAEIVIGALLRGREQTEQEILLDAYAPKGMVQPEWETITYPITVGSGKNQFTLKERLHLETGEQPMLQLEKIWGRVQLSEIRAETDGLEIEGSLTAEILYACEADEVPICMIQRGIPFSQRMELRGVQPGDAAEVFAHLEEIDFQTLSEKEGELRATVNLDATVTRQAEGQIMTGITSAEEAEAEVGAGAVIYLVQPGDTLWQIAKKYRTTIEDILAVNEIEQAALIYPGQKLLIVKMIH